MQIIERTVESITPYNHNPRKIPKSAIERVAASIHEFGFKVPIVLDNGGTIIAGHTRYLAAKELQLKSIPCIIADDLTPAQVKAFRIADNKVAEASRWDDDRLAQELADLEAELANQMSMFQFGFTEADYHEQEVGPNDFDVDVALSSARIRSRVESGQIWRCGRHRVMCGDSTSMTDMEKLMDGVQSDMILTDPPYNVAYEGKTADALTIDNDSMDEDSFVQFLIASFSTMAAALKPGGAFYIWHSDNHRKAFLDALQACNLEVRQCLVWIKNVITLGRQDYQWQHEPCLYGWKAGAPHYFIDDRSRSTCVWDDTINIDKMDKTQLKSILQQIIASTGNSTVLRESKPLRNDLHPTMKPIALFSRLIANSTRRYERESERESRVLDPFGGSGTTLVCCEQMGRSSYTMELSPSYCQVIIERWERLTGDTAMLEQ